MARKAKALESLKTTLKAPADTWVYDGPENLKWFKAKVELTGCEVDDSDPYMLMIRDKRGIEHMTFATDLFVLYSDGQGEAWDSVEFHDRFNIS